MTLPTIPAAELRPLVVVLRLSSPQRAAGRDA